jgi:hypothetical protein
MWCALRTVRSFWKSTPSGPGPPTPRGTRRTYGLKRFASRPQQSGYASRYPEAVALLLHDLRPHAPQPFLNCTQVADMFSDLVRFAVPRPTLDRICDELARLGCENAAELRRLLA